MRDATTATVAGVVFAAVTASVLGTVYPASWADVGVSVVLGSLPAALAGLGMLCRRPRMSTPADRVTLARAVLASGCAVVASMALVSAVPVRTGWFLALAATTLLLDAVDGAVARRTDTATAAGARLDMEVDAGFLVVLGVAVATAFGVWVLLIGAMRYLYLAVSYLRPVLRTPVPPSQFRRVVASVQGIALLVALAPVIPLRVADAALVLALLLLVASFGHQAVAVTGQALR